MKSQEVKLSDKALMTIRQNQKPAGEHSGAFSSWRTCYIPQELVEITNRRIREWKILTPFKTFQCNC